MTIITDLGESHTIVASEANGNATEVMHIPRYGVWERIRGKHECVDVGDDLDKLQAKYGPDLEVVMIKSLP